MNPASAIFQHFETAMKRLTTCLHAASAPRSGALCGRLKCKFLSGVSVVIFAAEAAAQPVPESVVLEEYSVAETGRAVWIYTPRDAPEGQRLPCVLIAPAGSYLMDGVTLGEGDMAEHLPYVEAGFVVVGYDLTGPLPEDPGEEDIVKCVTAFTGRDGGIEDARDAIKLALEKCPMIDPERLFVAGHSSAGTLALMLAQTAPKLRGCVAYAPVADLHARYGDESMDTLKEAGVDLRGYADRFSPIRRVADLKCPVLIFHAADDHNVDPAELRVYAEEAKKAGKAVERIEVADGGHYDSMIDPGISKGIAFLKGLMGALKP